MPRESKILAKPTFRRQARPVLYLRSAIREPWINKTTAMREYKLKEHQLATIAPAEVVPNPYNSGTYTYRYRLSDITELLNREHGDAVQPVQGRPINFGIIDLTVDDHKCNRVNSRLPTFRKPGRTICKTTAQTKYKLSRKQMERIKPCRIGPNASGLITHSYYESDVKELAERVRREKEQKKNSPKKTRSPKKSKKTVMMGGSAGEPIVVDDD